jgi:RNA recognition motif-containing protein
VEFYDSALAAAAIARMDGTTIGGRTIKVKPAARSASSTITANIKPASLCAVAAITSVSSTTVVLDNMLGPGELADAELEREVAEECAKLGPVLGVAAAMAGSQVRMYVRFTAPAAALAALAKLNNRWFGGRVIAAKLVPNTEFPSSSSLPPPPPQPSSSPSPPSQH